MSTSTLEARAVWAFSRVAGALPWGIGQYRLANPYVRSGRWPIGSRKVQTFRTGLVASLDLGDETQALAYMLRDYSPALHSFIVDRLPPQGIFFDVGSNIGLIAFTVSSRRPDVAIHAFEPNPANATIWRENHRLNGSSTAVLAEVALSDRNGTAAFSVPSDSASGMIGGRAPGGDTFQVRTTTLDDYCSEQAIAEIDVLKIDVQGHEPAVLDGTRRMLARGAIRTVICEVTAESVSAVGITEDDITGPLEAAGLRRTSIPYVGARRLLGRPPPGDDVAYVAS